jgi:hypothetical protein
VGSLTSHSSIGLQGLLRGQIFLQNPRTLLLWVLYIIDSTLQVTGYKLLLHEYKIGSYSSRRFSCFWVHRRLARLARSSEECNLILYANLKGCSSLWDARILNNRERTACHFRLHRNPLVKWSQRATSSPHWSKSKTGWARCKEFVSLLQWVHDRSNGWINYNVLVDDIN